MRHRSQVLVPVLTIPLALCASFIARAADVPIPVCTDPANQIRTVLTPDGAGGAIIGWWDARSNGTFGVHHLLASDALDPTWPVNGLLVGLNAQFGEVVPDGAGGAILTWYTEPTPDIYAHHALASGVVDPAWPAGGLPICVQPDNQIFPKLVSDGAGGAIITWFDSRNPGTTWDIYAQHVLSTGAIAPDDVSDRQVATREVGRLGAGRHVVSLAAAGTLPPGVYLIHLVQGEQRIVRRGMVMR